MSQYEELWRYIQVNCSEDCTMTYDKAEEVSGVPVDNSILKHRNELLEYGFKIEKVSAKRREFEIRKL